MAPRSSRRRPALRLVELEDRITPILDYLPTVLPVEHADLSFGYDGASWQGQGVQPPGGTATPSNKTLLFLGRPGHTTVTDPQFAFLGANAAGDVWTIPQTPNGLPLLSVGVTASGTFDSYAETD